MAQEPSRLFGKTKHTADLQGPHSLLGSHHEMRRGEPFVERDLAALVQRSDRHRERLAASVALVETGAMASCPS